MDEGLLVVVLFVGIPLVIIAMLSWVLHYFVALNAPPQRRALWIAGISYTVASALWLFSGPEGMKWQGPFAALPGGLLAYWFWHNDFKRDWIDDAEGVPEGVELANTDWRIGLLGLLALLLVAAVKVIAIRGAVAQ